MENCEIENINALLDNSSESYDIIVGYFVSDRDSLIKYKKLYPETVNKIIYDDIIPHFWMEPQIFCVDRSYYEQHDDSLTWLYNNLADDDSRKALLSFVEQRISGDFKYADGVLSDAAEEYFDTGLIRRYKKMTLIDCGAYDGHDTKVFFNKVWR